jgi:MFS family permease
MFGYPETDHPNSMADNPDVITTLPDFRPHDEKRASQISYDSPKASMYKARHISLQPRVESIQDFQDLHPELNQSYPDVSAPYGRSYRSRSYLLNESSPASDNGKENEKFNEKYTEKGKQREENEEITDMAADHSSPPPPAIKMSTMREILFVFVVAIAHFMTQGALGQALVPIDIISGTFHITSPGQAAWFIAGYSLTVGTFVLISGRLGDIIGHKQMFCFGYAWFGVWSAFAGFAAYPERQVWFDFCRAMQGIGPSIIMTNGLALFGRAYPPGIKKNIVFSIFGSVAPAGFVCGAAFSSLFAELVWWPWAFWSYALTLWGLTILALVVIPRELGEKPINPPRFDWSGSILGVIGLMLINIAWNNAPLYGWGTPQVYFILIIGLLAMVGFFWIEKRAISPLLPMSALNGSSIFVLLCVGIGWGAFGVWVFYICRFLATIRHATPLSIAAQFGPTPICGLLASGLTGFMLTHTPVSFTMFISMCAFCLGIIITATQPAQQSYWAQTFVSMIIMPFGMDMSFPAASVILSNLMPPEHQGLAQSLVSTFVNYFISISLGIAGTVEVNVVKNMDPTSEETQLKGFYAAFYTAIGLSAGGVLCGAIFFGRSMMREGWKVMDH